MARTASGIDYEVHLPDGYSERYARAANAIRVRLSCRWEDAADFKRDVMGFTEVDRGGATPKLRRSLPLLCPTTATKYAQSMDLADFGTEFRGGGANVAPVAAGDANQLPLYEQEPDLEGDPDLEGWVRPVNGRVFYDVTFARPEFQNLLTDAEAWADPAGELSRFARWRDQFHMRELRRPDQGFETDEATPVKCGLVGFVPDTESEFSLTWYEVPKDAVPRLAVAAAALHVNDDTFGGYEAGQLLLKGMRGQENWYEKAGGSDELYVDLTYIIGWKQYGWNTFLKTVGTRVGMRRVGTSGSPVPPYPEIDFATLFVPE